MLREKTETESMEITAEGLIQVYGKRTNTI
jgi:hypothetical protein